MFFRFIGLLKKPNKLNEPNQPLVSFVFVLQVVSPPYRVRIGSSYLSSRSNHPRRGHVRVPCIFPPQNLSEESPGTCAFLSGTFPAHRNRRPSACEYRGSEDRALVPVLRRSLPLRFVPCGSETRRS